MAAISSEVAMGFLMKGDEMLMKTCSRKARKNVLF